MRDEQGFTLLEVLVAFVIASIALAVLFHGTLGGLRTAQVAGRYEEAVMRAQSHLAALTAGSLTPGDRQGEDGNGFHWRVRINPVGLAGSSALYAVYVSISWIDGSLRSVQLDSERIGLAPKKAP
jgi:general secretion pathway protein I